jgi:hypothetical protein
MRCWKPVSVLGLAMGMTAGAVSAQVGAPGAAAPAPAQEPPQVMELRRANDALQTQARFCYALKGTKEKAAFLGISGSPLPPVLREQLKLPRGVGMVVDYVEPKSPADEAGLKQYDVLHKLDDQLLINASQFAVLVRMHKAGDEVTLTLFRHGESTQLRAKLAEKEVMAMDEQNPWGAPPGPWRDAAGADVLFRRAPAEMAIEGRVPMLSGIPFLNNVFTKNPNAVGEMRWSDDQTDLSLSIRGNNRHLTVKDKSGKTLFDGSINTPDELQRVPQDLRPKIERLQELPGRIRLRAPATQPLPAVPGFGQPQVIRLRTAGGQQEVLIDDDATIRVQPPPTAPDEVE